MLTATAVGLLTGFFGVGGGFAVVPALVLALGFTMPVAVGTSLLVIAINSATALAARAGHGISIDWTVIGVFTAAAVIGSLLGGRVASRVRPEAPVPGVHRAAGRRRPLHRRPQHPPAPVTHPGDLLARNTRRGTAAATPTHHTAPHRTAPSPTTRRKP